jgi:endonuclease/exonuclease/phosphatase family metal-dependent hydrolase
MSRLTSASVLLVSFVAFATSLSGCALEEGEDTGKDELALKGPKKDEKDTGRRFEVLTHNVGGGAENDGGEAGIAYTFSRIDATKPDVVMLEEVCQAQVDAFKARYVGWSVLFAPMTTNVGAEKCGGTPKGQLLASPRAMTEAIRKDLGDPDGVKSFTLLCGEVPVPGTKQEVLACVTHLHATGNDFETAESARKRQAWRIADTLEPRASDGQAVVLAGDFNAGPGRAPLDNLYRLTTSGKLTGGKFDEADQTDESVEKYAPRDEVRCAANACRTGEATMATNNAKLDYVFFSHNRVVDGQLGASVESNGGSGHKLYRAWANLDL